jgi:hypothetical protein
MLRPALLVLALCACGSVCDHAATSERVANRKINTCQQQPITEHDAARCNSGLRNCSPADLEQIEAFARCLDQLAVCEPANNTSWGIQRSGCFVQIFGRISGACTNAIL